MVRLIPLLSIVLVCAAATALAEEPAEAEDAFERPAYQVLRFNEDWSDLRGRDRSTTGDFFDPIKFIPLNDDESIWLNLGGSARQRLELWDDFNFGALRGADHCDAFLLTRLTLYSDLHLGPHLRFFFEGKSAMSTDRDLVGGRRTLDTDELDLQNGFIELTLPWNAYTFTLRAGRQELLFGKQRLVSPLDWSNTRRTWDGFSARVQRGDWTATGFWTQFAPVEKYSFNEPDAGVQFFGLYATGKCPELAMNVDLYWLGLDAEPGAFVGSPFAAFNGTAGYEQRHTVGGRLSGNVAQTRFDYDLEGAYQFGELGSSDINAFMVATQVGYAISDAASKPRIYVGFDYASGDDSPGGDIETFNQLFPLGHAYLGYIDTIGRQNIVDLSTGVSASVTEKLSLALDGHYFWRADDDDVLYNAGGGVVRPGAAGNSSDVGAEIDLTVKYVFDRHLTLTAGYSHFFAGDFIEESGPDRDIDFAYFMWQYTF